MSEFMEIQGAFTKGFIEDKGRNKIPAQFAGYAKNVRIVNASTTVRKGIIALHTLPTPIQGTHLSNNSELLTVAGGNLYKGSTLIGPVPNTGKVNFVSYGKYTVLLTGLVPYVYSPGGGLVAVPASNLITSNIVGSIPTPNPIIGASLTGFTFIANNRTGYRNILHISKPIVPDTPENCYDWSTTSGTNQYGDVGENRAMTSNIVGMVGNLNYLYIFCERTIEVLERGSVQQFNSKGYLVTTPIGDGDQLANPRSLICAGQKVFYWTKNLEIKTIGLEPGIDYPMIGELSNRKGQSIQGWINENLNRDQSQAFMIYDKKENTIELYCKSKSSGYNDRVLVYHIIDDTFTYDEGKVIAHGTNDYFSGLENVYLIGANGTVHQDDQFYYDEVSAGTIRPISFEYDTVNLSLGDPTREKLFRGFGLAGAMNTASDVRITCYIDGKEEFDKYISHGMIKASELKAINIGGPDKTPDGLNTLSPFEYVADHGMVRKKGKRIRVRIRGDVKDQNFYFDSLSVNATSTSNAELSDKY